MTKNTLTTEESIKRILSSIRLSCQFQKFALYFIECSLSIQQKKHIADLTEQCKILNINLVHIDVGSEIVKDLRQKVYSHLKEKYQHNQIPSNLALVITGLESSILLDNQEDQPAVLQVMNLGRENYAKFFPYAFIIFLSDKMLQRVQHAAPDFWSWRSAEPERFEINVDFIEKETKKVFSLAPINSCNNAVERVSLLERLIEAYDEFYDNQNTPETIKQNKLKLLSSLGDAYKFLEKHQKARKSYEKALNIAKALNDSEQWTALLNKQGIVMREMKKFDQALHLFEEYLNTARDNQDAKMQGAVLNNIGLVYLDKGATQKAIETLEQALILNQKTSQLKAMADTLGNMGLVYLSQNDVDKAIDYLNQSLKLSAGFKNEGRSFQNDLMNLGAAYFKQGLIRVAFAYYLAARHFYRKNGDLVGEKESLIELARCALEDMETFEQNREMLVQIQLMLFKTGLAAKLETDELLGPKTKMALKQIDSEEELFKDKSDPLIYYENALEITRQMLDDRSEYTILTDLSSAYRRMKNIDKAISCCEDAMKKAQDLVDIKAEISCLITLLQLYSSDEAYDPDKVAGYKEKAKILLRKRGILKADNLYVWIMDYHKTPSMALLKDANYKLCLSIGTPPENFLTAGKQTAFPTAKIELIYNLIEENPLSFEPKVRGKMTETEVTEKLQPIIKGLQKLEPGELSEHQPPAYTEDADTIVTAVPLIEEKPSDKEVLGQPYEVSKVATPVEIEVNVEGIGIDCERSKDILTGSEFLDFPIIPKEIGEQRLVIKCKANEIRFDTMLAVKVEKGQTRFTRLLRSKPIENLSVENVKAMLREQDFYDKFYNPKGKGIRHEYELIERQGKKLVIDHATGLMWQQSGSKIRMSYNNALEYIGTLNINHFAGYNDWRLPTLEEAMSLVVVEPKMVADLYIDFLFDSHQRWIWTADKESSEWLWVVSFSHSRCNRSRFGSDARYVRGVR